MAIVLQGASYIRHIGSLTMPDPNMHALGAYALATGQSFGRAISFSDEFGNERKTLVLEGDASYVILEESRNDTVTSIVGNGLAYLQDASREAQIEASEELQGRDAVIPFDNSDQAYAESFNRPTQYFPISWAAPAVGVGIGVASGLDGYDAYTLGRVTNLMAYVAIAGASIALVPRMKVVMGLLAAMPPAVFCASSLMCDALLASLCMLSVALTLRCLERRQCTRGSVAALSACAAMVTLIKATYLPVCMGFLLVGRDVLSTKRKLLALAPVVAAGLAYLAWSGAFGDVLAQANIADNISFMLSHPLKVLVRIAYTLLAATERLVNEAPVGWLLFGILALAAAAGQINRLPGGKGSYRFVIGSIAAGLSSFALVALSMLAIWNDASSASSLSLIAGMQGRYLIPLLPLICYSQTRRHPPELIEGSHSVSSGREESEKGETHA